ncbi:MAG: NAD(P)/FAD-dependent oxidoreductase [Steroidobacteraceae bacterium]
MDCIVIGAGVIGLAVARALARGGREVIILECERHFGMHTSSRNSEVIHAGIHYKPQSLKARMCISGKELLYRYCAERGIAHRRCGKFTVATSEAQLPALQAIAANARESGVFDLQWLDGAQARRLEPALACTGALSSPSTGIIDSHAYMQSLLADAESCGASIVYGTQVASMRAKPGGVEILIGTDTDPAVRARAVVNSAGLNAQRVAASIEGFGAQHIPKIFYGKGSYFGLTGAAPFARLIYPAPPAARGHLGIHMTLDLAGAARFGPDLEWVDHVEYAVDPRRASEFHAAIREYWPQLDPGRLRPAYAGIRPKLAGPGEEDRDFCVSGPAEHGVGGIVNLFGMGSPGLTSSLALGEYIAAQLR